MIIKNPIKIALALDMWHHTIIAALRLVTIIIFSGDYSTRLYPTKCQNNWMHALEVIITLSREGVVGPTPSPGKPKKISLGRVSV